MKSLLIALSLFSTFAFAETTTVTVEGMHCSACKKEVADAVCKNEKLKADIKSCEVSFVSKKDKIGQVVITSKQDKHVDVSEVKKLILAADKDFKVSKDETK